MARIQTPQHVQEVTAEFKVREPFELELLETIQPTYSLGRQKIASTGYPRKCIGIVAAGAGGVGTNIECGIECPGDVGIVILLEQIWVREGSAGMRITDGTAMATVSSSPTTKNYRDARLTGQRPDGILRIANPLTAAPNGDSVASIEVLADQTDIYEPEIILGGDAYFLVRNAAANDGLTVSFLWTEFLLEDR